MTERRAYRIRKDNPRALAVARDAAQEIMRLAELGVEFDINLREPKRTLDANSCMWATLTDISKQVTWDYTRHGNWKMDLMSPDAWKSVCTAAFEQETEMARGINGGFVMLGARTSEYSKKKMGEFIEFVHAFGAEKGVRWSAKARDELAEFSRAKA